MPNKEEITASLRLSGYLDWVPEGNLRRFTSKLHKLGGSRLLMEWPEPCMWDGCKTPRFLCISNRVWANQSCSPQPPEWNQCQNHVVQQPSWDRLQLIPKSSPSLRSIFSSDKAPSGNTAGWRKEILRSKKNSGGSRKFNQIGTNGICFSVSPAPSVFLSKWENHREMWGQKTSLADLTLQNRSSLQVSREHHNYNSIFSITYSPWEKLQTFSI